MSNPPRKIVTPADLQPKPSYHCPECKELTPPFAFTLHRYNLGVLGAVEYFVVSCGASKKRLAVDLKIREIAEPEVCGCILAVNVISYQPPTNPEQVEALLRQMRGEGPKQ
jgi:hypothetical protein